MGSIRRIFEHADRETRRRRDHAAIGAAIIDQLHFAVADRQSIMLRYCLMSYSGRVGKRDSRRDGHTPPAMPNGITAASISTASPAKMPVKRRITSFG